MEYRGPDLCCQHLVQCGLSTDCRILDVCAGTGQVGALVTKLTSLGKPVANLSIDALHNIHWILFLHE